MGKARKFKAMRKAVGLDKKAEVKYDVTNVHNIIFQGKDKKDDVKVPVSTLVCVGPMGTYREMKKQGG